MPKVVCPVMLGDGKARAGCQWTKTGSLPESKGDREESQESEWTSLDHQWEQYWSSLAGEPVAVVPNPAEGLV